jgi:pimeloyl-ACP methyl ester carboxylesterase
MEQMTLDGTRIAYRQQGDGEPVLLLHPGFVADGMLPLLDQPALAGFRLIVDHRRGYGHSDRTTGPVSLVGQAEDAVGLLDRLGIDRVHLVGHSFGANIALQFALTTPERVGGLALLGSALGPGSAQFLAETAQQALPRLQGGDAAGALAVWLTGAFGPGFRPVLERALPGSWQLAVADAPTPFGVELPALQQWPVGPDDLARVGVPTLSLVHQEERWSGFGEIHELLRARVPGCEATTVELSSHLLQIADPPAMAEPVAAFVSRHRLLTKAKWSPLLTVCSQTVRILLDVTAHVPGMYAGQAHIGGRACTW